jgi:hypothetical protein
MVQNGVFLHCVGAGASKVVRNLSCTDALQLFHLFLGDLSAHISVAIYPYPVAEMDLLVDFGAEYAYQLA